MKNLLSWAAVLIAALFINMFVGTTVGIQGESMSPNLTSGDRAFSPLWQNWWPGSAFARGDVVYFPDPLATGCRSRCPWVIKRIIGLPGETVAIEAGTVTVNGELLEEPWLQGRWHGSINQEPVVVPEGSYFVLGDNRFPYGSVDSRQYGPVAADSIAGRASFVFWPLLRRSDGGWRLYPHAL